MPKHDRRWIRLLAAGVLMVAATGCVGGTAGPAQGGPGQTGSAANAVDPQVLADVIEWTYPVPGETVRRSLRVARAINSIQTVDCGGEPFVDLDYTGDRIDQALFPDLELIQEKGLTETSTDSQPEPVGSDLPCRRKSLPQWQDVDELSGAWVNDQVRQAFNTDPVAPLVVDAGACLAQKSGLPLGKVGGSSLLELYFVEVDSAAVEASNISDEAAEATRRKYAAIFVECLGDYAATMRRELMAKRPAEVERNRELLTAMARGLTAAGYVP